ncbi:MAG: hypothetical protein WCR67_02040 [Bacilli bacterium]
MNFDLKKTLSPYLAEKDIETVSQAMEQTPVSSFIFDGSPKSLSLIREEYPDIQPDENDSFICHFRKDENQLGKSLLHFAGAFYIMDSSSACISKYLAKLIPANPLVLDMCAAPGGKSIAFALRRKDSLISACDISYQRALEIAKNTDRLGLTNVFSFPLDPVEISLPSMFDLIILDAPCSGSGMFRKELKMLDDWSEEKVQRLLPVQHLLLEKAYSLVKKGGIIAYSTCSLSLEEDECQVKDFLSRHNDVQEVRISPDSSLREGKYGYHLLPGISQGEGIYFSFLKKESGDSYIPKEIKYKSSFHCGSLKSFDYRKNTFLLDRMFTELSKLPFIVPGIKVNDDSPHPKCQFDHAYCKVDESLPRIELTKKQALDFVSGQEITVESNLENSIVILSYKGFRLGFGKKVNSKIKNYLPKGLRSQLIED